MNVFHRICLVLGAIACINVSPIQSKIRRRRGAEMGSSLYAVVRILPHDDVTKLMTINSWIPNFEHSRIRVGNIGNVSIQCNCQWGTGDETWLGHVSTGTLPVAAMIDLPCIRDNALYATCLKVYNPNDELALAWCERGDYPVGPSSVGPESDAFSYEPEPVNFMISMENIVRLAVDTLVATDILVDIFQEIFFPEQKTDTWDEIRDKVDEQLDAAKQEIIAVLLGNDVKPIKYRIKDIQNNMDDPDIRRIYLNLADTLNGYDLKFVFDHYTRYKNADLNIALLGIFCRVVNMQLNYYLIGINSAEKLGLKESDIKRLRRYMKTIVPRAIEHIEMTVADRIESILYTGDLDNLFNLMMDARSSGEFCGRAYYYDWYKAALPDELPELENRTGLAYSNYYGFGTGKLLAHAYTFLSISPLSPKMKGPVTRSQLIKFRVWKCWNINICGLEVWFDNDEHRVLGALWSDAQQPETLSADRRIKSLRVSETGRAIRSLQFTFTDPEESKVNYGHNLDDNPHLFYKPNYYIASMFVGNDIQRMGKIIVNVAVSYQMDPETYRENGTLHHEFMDLVEEKIADARRKRK